VTYEEEPDDRVISGNVPAWVSRCGRRPAPTLDDDPDDAGHVQLRRQRARRHPAEYLDQVAYTCATRYARTYAVTLSVDQVVIREPVHVGELVTFDASVNRTGRTSMEVGVRVTAQDLVRQTVRHTNSCYFTMVALGPDGRPVPVPPWQPQTAEERRRHRGAERRNRLRREIDRAGTEIKQTSHDDEESGPS
jgi:acyl-CoA hydrolase